MTAGIGIAAAALVLVGCSDDKGSTPGSSSPAASGSSTQVSTSGNTEVKVEGQDLAGLDLNSVTCVKAGGKINVASGAVGGQQGVGGRDDRRDASRPSSRSAWSSTAARSPSPRWAA